jgi:hypothetical protein
VSTDFLFISNNYFSLLLAAFVLSRGKPGKKCWMSIPFGQVCDGSTGILTSYSNVHYADTIEFHLARSQIKGATRRSSGNPSAGDMQMSAWLTACWIWTGSGGRVSICMYRSAYNAIDLATAVVGFFFSGSLADCSPDHRCPAWPPCLPYCAARGNLDTLNMEFNMIVNEVKKLRLASFPLSSKRASCHDNAQLSHQFSTFLSS